MPNQDSICALNSLVLIDLLIVPFIWLFFTS